MYADIIIDISHEKLDRAFQYKIPDGLLGQVRPGSRVVIPFGRGDRKVTGYVVGLSDAPGIEPERIKEITGIPAGGLPIEGQLIELAAWMKSHYGGTMTQALKTVIPVKKKEREKIVRRVLLIPDEKSARDILDDMCAKKNHSVAKERLLRAMIEDRELPWDMITGKLHIPSTAIRDLEKRGILSVTESHTYRSTTESLSRDEHRVTLNSDQQAVLKKYHDTKAEKKPYLLYGVTGSGKTEVYLSMIEEVISRGQQAIVLIPEISLTYQTLVRFYRRFGERVSTINSRLTPAERYDQFEKAKRGEVSVMIGPRSALFTPFSKLGIIIMDEEHDDSYKSGQVPRYHARETAVHRGKLSGASVVLGSATPSVESFTHVKKGDYIELSMPRRVSGRSLPHCDIVDMREELRRGNRTMFSERLTMLIRDRLEKKEQLMLFLNRRGLVSSVSCRECGHVVKCPHCDVSLSLHRDGMLMCHYCGFTMPGVKSCPECGSKYIRGFRVGTQSIEDALLKSFPGIRVLRMDADTTRGKDGHREILESFSNHEADVLLGTQMIVKGHDFPGVTLMGIMVADLSLNASDYRGAEKTFQMLTQAAGRAGRGEVPGDVVIQTYQPDAYSITTAAAQDYDSFYEKEAAYRRLMAYPPFLHLLSVQITSEVEAQADGRASELKALIDDMGTDCSVLGPNPALIGKLRDIYRRVIYVRHRDYDTLIYIKDEIESFLLYTRTFDKSHTSFDFDPMSMI